MLMELGIDNKKRQRRKKNIPMPHCDCIKFDSSVSYLSHANSYLVQPNFSLSALFFTALLKGGLQSATKEKGKRLLFDVS